MIQFPQPEYFVEQLEDQNSRLFNDIADCIAKANAPWEAITAFKRCYVFYFNDWVNAINEHGETNFQSEINENYFQYTRRINNLRTDVAHLIEENSDHQLVGQQEAYVIAFTKTDIPHPTIIKLRMDVNVVEIPITLAEVLRED